MYDIFLPPLGGKNMSTYVTYNVCKSIHLATGCHANKPSIYYTPLILTDIYEVTNYVAQELEIYRRKYSKP